MNKKAFLFKRILYNLAGCLVTYVLFSGIVFKQKDYDWSIKMLEDNHDFIVDNGYMSLQERYASKMGYAYSLFDSVRSKTPDTAVIYLPGKEAFFPNDQKSIFTGEPFEKMWAIRFLYPRKVVTEREYKKSPYTKKINYVIIVNGIGAEKLKYKLPCPIQYGILYADSLQLTNQ